MDDLTRRDLFAAGAAVSVAGTLSQTAMAAPAPQPTSPPATPSIAAPALQSRQRLKCDFGWRFHLGHAVDPAQDFGFGESQNSFAKSGANVATAAAVDFDDSGWQAVDLPHDWAMALPFTPSLHPPAEGDDDAAGHGYKPLGRDFPATSIGWYRRSFDIAASDLGKRIVIEFDGVFRDAQVMINGYIVGRNQSGYAPFSIDISDFVNYGARNVLTVRADATLGEGWFYEGAGIYRHVWLTKTDTLHIPQYGVWVRSQLEGLSASLSITTEIQNDGLSARRFVLVTDVIDPAGHIIATQKTPSSISGRQSRSLLQTVRVGRAQLWSLETPQLYHAVSRLVEADKAIDDAVTPFGLRSIRFDAKRGFLLNGVPVKLNGTCNHQDHAGVGIAIPDALQVWRVQKLKEMGSNAYRMAHNPPTPELLDACDRLGMLVIDETRRMSSDPESMGELTRLIRRDRNHPSVILWSIGNEEPQQGTPRGARIGAKMKALCRELDPDRPICAALDRPAAWDTGFGPLLDVVGANYHTKLMPDFHTRHPDRPIIGTETGSTVATRGIYRRDPASGYCAAYDTEHPSWATTAEEWLKIIGPAPHLPGGFVWTGFDYHGEPTPFNRWPNVVSQFGILDLCGFPKDNFFYYKAWWGTEPVLHLLPHWNWRNGESVNIWCHSNLDAVELLVNGKSLGRQNVPRFGHVEWNATFAPGAIEARGFKNDKMVLTDQRQTTGVPAKIILTTDRGGLNADGEDIAVITAAVEDRDGRVVPFASDTICFTVTGAARIIGSGNGDPRSHEPDTATTRNAFNGLCMALLQSNGAAGTAVINATAPGLTSASLSLQSLTTKPIPRLA
ncbi:MAG: beta-galactosidase GalA [Rhizomicrobium sp.]